MPAESGLPVDRADISAAVVVPATAEHAWAGLTEHLHLWWPADELSRWGDGSFFDLEDNALVETSTQDDENVWGEVIDGRPGEWLELSWKHVGAASSTSLRLDLTGGASNHHARAESAAQDSGFAGEQVNTTLTVTHGGWIATDPQDLYQLYREFWPNALARFQRFMGGS